MLNLVTQESDANKALENPGADQLMAKWGGDKAGLPFMVFLNGKGEKVTDSNRMPGGKNIGCPASAEEIAEFDRILQQTAPKITAGQRAKIGGQFRARSEKRQSTK